MGNCSLRRWFEESTDWMYPSQLEEVESSLGIEADFLIMSS
jgi:hypothetical protein